MNTNFKRVLCPKLPKKPGDGVALSQDEGKHLTQVLRLEPGDQIEAMDGQGASVRARLERRGKEIWLIATEAARTLSATDLRAQVAPVTVELAILKGEAMEWAIEKCVELGVERVTPLITDHAVVKIERKGPEAFVERWQKIADQALKQCGRVQGLVIDLPQTVAQLLKTPLKPGAARLWTDEVDRGSTPSLPQALKPLPSQVHLLIGPEGGWSHAERALLTSSIGGAVTSAASLGELVLRAETATLFAASLAVSAFRQKAD